MADAASPSGQAAAAPWTCGSGVASNIRWDWARNWACLSIGTDPDRVFTTAKYDRGRHPAVERQMRSPLGGEILS